MYIKLLLIILVGLTFTSLFAESTQKVYLSADSLSKYLYVTLQGDWSFNPADNPHFADTSFDTQDWKPLSSKLDPHKGIPEGWSGTGWFRRWVEIDSNLVGKVVGVGIWQTGIHELYINGIKQYSMGSVKSGEKYSSDSHSGIRAVVFDKPGSNLIAVRYSNYDLEYFQDATFLGGFIFSFGDYHKLIKHSLDSARTRSIYQVFFISIPLAIAFVHLFLFLYDRRTKDNIFYVIFLLSFALFIYTTLQRGFVEESYFAVLLYKLTIFGLIATITTGCMAIYSIIRGVPRMFVWFVLAGLALSVTGFLTPGIFIWYASYAFIMIVSVPTGRTVWKSRKNGLGGEWIIRAGFVFMSALGITTMLQSFDIVPPIFGITALYVYGVLGFIVSMSASLARDFFVTNKRLEKQLATVKELSEKTLKQELAAKELETKKKILEADNDRKTTELDSARNLQLSMLPQTLPKIEGLEIAAHMQTATEVGGDYYDFAIAKDGTLNIAVGDATGHGTKAGIMVATVKSLFAALGSNMMIRDFFSRCTEILKDMNLGNLFMSMTLLRIKSNYVIASAAGMPPLLIYKKNEQEVGEFIIKGMPLGAFTGYEYDEIELELNSGDIILLMTDGFTELFNERKEMYGDKRIMELLKANEDKSPDELVNVMVQAAADWRGSISQGDDITFVILKMK